MLSDKWNNCTSNSGQTSVSENSLKNYCLFSFVILATLDYVHQCIKSFIIYIFDVANDYFSWEWLICNGKSR